MDRIQANTSEITHLWEVELPDGRQLIDIDGEELARLSEVYRCSVEVIFDQPKVRYLPLRPINVSD